MLKIHEVHMVRLTMAVASHLASPEETADAILAALEANRPAGVDRMVATVETAHGDDVRADSPEAETTDAPAMFGRNGGRHVVA